jgi:excisionase family DNA binding protein
MTASATSDALPGERLLSVPEAARMLEVSPATLRGWIREGMIPAYRTGRTRLWLRREDVERRQREEMRARFRAGIPDRMTPEEQEAMRIALEKSRDLREQLLAERGGVPFPDSTELIREMREERSRQLYEAATGRPYDSD